MADSILVINAGSSSIKFSLTKQLELLGDARCAGIVLGARVPIILTHRADDALTRLASCALAVVQRQQRLVRGS